MMNNDDFIDCVWKCARECEDRECKTGIPFICSIECETKCIEKCRLQTNKPGDGEWR